MTPDTAIKTEEVVHPDRAVTSQGGAIPRHPCLLETDSLWSWTRDGKEGGVPVREVRLGITMVGGSSLAVYENGVAQELFRLIHGRDGYSLLKRLTHSHIFVDILSGTSAGGINTIMLAAALATGSDLSRTKELWIASGGIGDLMQDPLNRNVKSLLQGNEYYLKSLGQTFRDIYDHAYTPGAGDVPSPQGGLSSQDLDLFVTGTFCEGKPFVFFDAFGRSLASKDHRGVFQLKHRPLRGESHFDPTLDEPAPASPLAGRSRKDTIITRLARIARTTSSLPAVFEPSEVKPEEVGNAISLPRREGPSYMVDGGYLNNKPMNLTLQAIYKRPAAREVIRKFFFVDPVPDKQEALPPKAHQPNALENLCSFSSIPGYQSHVTDLEGLEEHNRRVLQLRAVLEQVHEEMANANAAQTSSRQHDLWLKLRLTRLVCGLESLWRDRLIGPGNGSAASQTETDALRCIVGRLQKLLKDKCLDFHRYAVPDVRTIITSESIESSDVDTPPDNGFSLSQVDSAFAVRKIYRLIYDLFYSLYSGGESSSDACECSEVGGPPSDSTKASGTRKTIDHRHKLRADEKASWRQVEPYLNEWYLLRDLLGILEITLNQVCAQLANSPEYRAAKDAVERCRRGEANAGQALEQAVQQLWVRLRSAAGRLLVITEEDLKPAIDNGARALLGRLRDAGEGSDPLTTLAPLNLTPEDLRAFKKFFAARADVICGTLVPNAAEAAQAGPDVTGRTIIDWVSRIMDRQVKWAADTLAGSPAHPQGEAWPLQWAAGKTPEQIAIRCNHVDAYLYPFEAAMDLESLDLIELVRISPGDWQDAYSNKPAKDKLAGDEALNLAGFFKRAWRANDILWGRLDAANALVCSLLDRPRLVELLEEELPTASNDMDERRRAAGKWFDCFLDLFAGKGDRFEEIHRYLQARIDNERGVIVDWLAQPTLGEQDGDGFVKLRNLLLTRLQLDILMDEVPQAVAEEESEQREWAASSEDSRSRHDSPENGLECPGQRPSWTTRAYWRSQAKTKAERSFSRNPQAQTLVPDSQKLADFFSQYKIGEESITHDIPAPVLLHQGTGMVLIAVHILEKILKDSKAFGGSALGRWLSRLVLKPVGLVAFVFYCFFNAVTQGPKAALLAQTVAMTILVVSLAAILAPIAGLQIPGSWRWVGFLLPAVLLFVYYRFYRRRKA